MRRSSSPRPWRNSRAGTVIGRERFRTVPHARFADMLRDGPGGALKHGHDPRDLRVPNRANDCAATGLGYAAEPLGIPGGFRLGKR